MYTMLKTGVKCAQLCLLLCKNLGLNPGVGTEDIAETRDFLRWVHDDHFTFLGYREYDFKGKGKIFLQQPVKKGHGYPQKCEVFT